MTDVSEQIRQDIDVTRKHLSDKMTALTESARPSSMLRRRTIRAKRTLMRMKNRIMAMTPEGEAGTAAMRNVGSAAINAPEVVRRAAIRNPIAVGIAAFGMGWFVGSRMAKRRRHSIRKRASEAVEQAKPLVKQAAETVRHAGESVKHATEKTIATGKSAME
jgi:hypothetical protein